MTGGFREWSAGNSDPGLPLYQFLMACPPWSKPWRQRWVRLLRRRRLVLFPTSAEQQSLDGSVVACTPSP